MDTERPIVRYAPWNSNDCAEQRLRQASPGEYGDGRDLSPALSAPPHAEGDDDRTRQREPRNGVLQVIVLEMHGERAGFWNAALGRRRFQIDIERRDGLAALAPAQRARHRKMMAGEPEPFGHALRRRQRAGAFGKSDVAGELHRITRDQPADGAILLVAILHRVLNESGIDHDGV